MGIRPSLATSNNNKSLKHKENEVTSIYNKKTPNKMVLPKLASSPIQNYFPRLVAGNRPQGYTLTTGAIRWTPTEAALKNAAPRLIDDSWLPLPFEEWKAALPRNMFFEAEKLSKWQAEIQERKLTELYKDWVETSMGGKRNASKPFVDVAAQKMDELAMQRIQRDEARSRQ